MCVSRTYIYKVVSCIVYNISFSIFAFRFSFSLLFTVTHIDRFGISACIYIFEIYLVFCKRVLLFILSVTPSITITFNFNFSIIFISIVYRYSIIIIIITIFW